MLFFSFFLFSSFPPPTLRQVPCWLASQQAPAAQLASQLSACVDPLRGGKEVGTPQEVPARGTACVSGAELTAYRLGACLFQAFSTQD
jgi:hypothetical protein